MLSLQVCDDPVAASLNLAKEISDNSGPIAVRTLVKTLRGKQNQGLNTSLTNVVQMVLDFSHFPSLWD